MLLLICNCVGGENSWFVLEIMDGSSVKQKKMIFECSFTKWSFILKPLIYRSSCSEVVQVIEAMQSDSVEESVYKGKNWNAFKFREWTTLWLFCSDQIWHEAHTSRHTGWFKWALITTNQSCVMTHEAGISAGVSSQLMHLLLIWYYGSTRLQLNIKYKARGIKEISDESDDKQLQSIITLFSQLFLKVA